MISSSSPYVGFAGTSYLGLVSAAVLGSRGVPVAAFDPDTRLIDAISPRGSKILQRRLRRLFRYVVFR